MKKILVVVALLLTQSCAAIHTFRTYGGSADINCYSGGRHVYSATSSGKVYSDKQSKTYLFVSKEDHKLVKVPNTCVVDYEKY